MRALLALLLLAIAPEASASCVGDVCAGETEWGDPECDEGARGSATDASARNVMLGFPLTAHVRGEHTCTSTTATRTLTIETAAGQHGSAGFEWQSSNVDNRRAIHWNATTVGTDHDADWWSEGTYCRVSSDGTLATVTARDTRPCPHYLIRPPEQPAIPWGEMLP